MAHCHACKAALSLGRTVGRKDVCPSCGADIHCCLNCVFYDRNAPKQCREPMAELVRDKERANFCDFFKLNEKPSTAGDSDAPQRARKALDDLFKK